MVSRTLIGLGITALAAIIILNVLPLFRAAEPAVYIEQGHISGMSLVQNGMPYTLNFDQQKRSIDILNRAVDAVNLSEAEKSLPIAFSSLVIHRFEQDPIMITPIMWKDKNLVFNAPLWSENPLMEVSNGELYMILDQAYDKDLPQKAAH